MNEINAKDKATPFELKNEDKEHESEEIESTHRHVERDETLELDEMQQGMTAIDKDERTRPDSAESVSPSAILEMFHYQDEENVDTIPIVRDLVENEISGEFYQVRTRQRKAQSSLSTREKSRFPSLLKAPQKPCDNPTKAENRLCWSLFLHGGEKAAVIMVLGIVAGMCWMNALNLHTGYVSTPSGKDDSFRCAYSAGANRSRQNFFVLFKYPFHDNVLVGLLRRLSQLDMHQQYKALGDDATAELTSYRLLRGAIALLFTAHFVLLIESPSALRLSQAQQTNAKWCDDMAPTSTLYQTGISILEVCAILNTILVTTAWFLVALQCSMTTLSSTANRCRIVELLESLSEHQKRVCELQGTHLDDSSADDLKALIQLHHRAIALTESVLVSKLQVQHQPSGVSMSA